MSVDATSNFSRRNPFKQNSIVESWRNGLIGVMEIDHNLLEESVLFVYSGCTLHLQERSDAPITRAVCVGKETSLSY